MEVSPGLRPTRVRLSTTGVVKLCWGLNLSPPPSSPVADELELARFVFALAAPERPGLVEQVLSGGDRASLSVLSDLIAEAEPALASAAALVLWSEQPQEATQVLAEHLEQADVTWLWQCVAPFFPPAGWAYD
jgi:Asp-tRNA(Asn)/Glu-tRNA(Gln) amidotransferase A subunit family amidase